MSITITVIYTKEEMVTYAESILDNCLPLIQDNAMQEPSGYEWLPMNAFEKHIYNIRHLRHHIGQLVEKLHAIGIRGIEWKG